MFNYNYFQKWSILLIILLLINGDDYFSMANKEYHKMNSKVINLGEKSINNYPENSGIESLPNNHPGFLIFFISENTKYCYYVYVNFSNLNTNSNINMISNNNVNTNSNTNNTQTTNQNQPEAAVNKTSNTNAITTTPSNEENNPTINAGNSPTIKPNISGLPATQNKTNNPTLPTNPNSKNPHVKQNEIPPMKIINLGAITLNKYPEKAGIENLTGKENGLSIFFIQNSIKHSYKINIVITENKNKEDKQIISKPKIINVGNIEEKIKNFKDLIEQKDNKDIQKDNLNNLQNIVTNKDKSNVTINTEKTKEDNTTNQSNSRNNLIGIKKI